MLTEEGLRALLRFTLKTVGPADLPELVSSLCSFFTDLKPAELHDALNCLLGEGLIGLDKEGKYFVP